MSVPTVAEVERITAMPNPVIRNLHITQCYFELSGALTRLTGTAANWCTFATWASKQAGQTIRREDLVRAVEDVVTRSAELGPLLAAAAHARTTLGLPGDARTLTQIVNSVLASIPAFRRSSDAVARGNRKVFEEIGREFARFLAVFQTDEAWDAATTARFCDSLRPGDPPQGQQLLRDAFTAYCESRFEPDEKRRAELHFYANLLVGLHEQTRLQPEIAEALDAAFHEAEELRDRLLIALLPSLWIRTRYRLARLLGRRLPLDVALDRIVEQLRREFRRIVTESLMTLRLSQDVVLRLGRDLDAAFPEPLRQLSHPGLQQLLARIDPTPDSLRQTGARDWADLDERMHYITDLFRCYHTWPSLFHEPFTAAQVSELKRGGMPSGRL